MSEEREVSEEEPPKCDGKRGTGPCTLAVKFMVEGTSLSQLWGCGVHMPQLVTRLFRENDGPVQVSIVHGPETRPFCPHHLKPRVRLMWCEDQWVCPRCGDEWDYETMKGTWVP